MTEQNKQDTQKNSKESDKVYTKKDVIRGGIIGWGIGVATTLLLAPKSGKELRGDITYQVGSAKDKAVDKSREISDSAMDKYAAIKENATNKTIELKDKLNPAKNTSSNEAKLDEEDPKTILSHNLIEQKRNKIQRMSRRTNKTRLQVQIRKQKLIQKPVLPALEEQLQKKFRHYSKNTCQNSFSFKIIKVTKT